MILVMYKYFNIYAIILDIQENLLTCMLKGVESNESWSWRQSVIQSYARNLFPKIVENKEFPHSYKKDRLRTSIGYCPDTLGKERMAF